MKKVLNVLLSVTVTIMVWMIIRVIWRSTVRFADIFGDTGGEDMALVIGILWLCFPTMSFARLIPSMQISTATWAATVLYSLPFFAVGFATIHMPVHQLAVDAVQGQHLYWSHVVPYQGLLWATAMLPFFPLCRWLWHQSALDQAPA